MVSLIDTDVMIDVSRRNAGAVSAYPVVHLDAAVGQLAYDLLKRYAGSHGLRTFDSLIAATAMLRGFELISRNRKHFAAIDGLQFRSPHY